jgi:hypothetical protein
LKATARGGIDNDAQVNDTLAASTRLATGVWRASTSQGSRNQLSDYRLTFNVTAGDDVDLSRWLRKKR